MPTAFLDDNEVLAGSYISRATSNHLSLAALSIDSSRAAVIGKLIDEYLSKKPINEMIEILAKEVVKTWKQKKLRKTFPTFTTYLEKDIRPRLKRRRISEEHANQILDRARTLNAKN